MQPPMSASGIWATKHRAVWKTKASIILSVITSVVSITTPTFWVPSNRHDLWKNGEEVFENGKYFPGLMVDRARQVDEPRCARRSMLGVSIQWIPFGERPSTPMTITCLARGSDAASPLRNVTTKKWMQRFETCSGRELNYRTSRVVPSSWLRARLITRMVYFPACSRSGRGSRAACMAASAGRAWPLISSNTLAA